jgi:hypothetical protein
MHNKYSSPKSAPRTKIKIGKKFTSSKTTLPTEKYPLQAWTTSNVQDARVCLVLAKSEWGALAIDNLFDQFKQRGSYFAALDRGQFRVDLVDLYLAAAERREKSKASSSEIKRAQNAAGNLKNAVSAIEKLVPRDNRLSLWSFLFNEEQSSEDIKGHLELNELLVTCRDALGSLKPALETLQLAISAERRKPSQNGERKKRLRTLVEALADWWTKSTGHRPTIITERTKPTKATLLKLGQPPRKQAPQKIERRSDFLDFSLALLSKVDAFKESEIISAIKNAVYLR